MFARSTTIKGDPAKVDAGIAYIRDEVLPVITTLDGCIGLSLVVDRESGHGIATSSWESEEAMAASRDAMATHRSRGGEILGGRPEVEEWEVALMHREHPTHAGACCRVVWSRAADVDTSIERFRSVALPALEEMDGFCSASLLVDRAGGRGCVTATFDSRETLDASREPAAAMRETGDRRGRHRVHRRRRVRPRARSPEAARAGLRIRLATRLTGTRDRLHRVAARPR